jgi:5-methyltetrahydropteroyltriglutamate--homocysteine methyltransferase
MPISTEPIGSIPRPAALIEGMRDLGAGRISQEHWRSLCGQAVRDTIQRFEATGSPVITDGEQTKRASRPIQFTGSGPSPPTAS